MKCFKKRSIYRIPICTDVVVISQPWYLDPLTSAGTYHLEPSIYPGVVLYQWCYTWPDGPLHSERTVW